MGNDVWFVFRWGWVLLLFGSAAWPLTKRLFTGWYDEGYLFSKAIGMAVVTWIVYASGTIHVLPFSGVSIFVSMSTLFVLGLLLHIRYQRSHGKDTYQIAHRKTVKHVLIVLLEELVFFLALLSWAWVKGHEPSIRSLEKYMDFGFVKSVLDTSYFPVSDMWYAGHTINYYYFGHIVLAILTKLSGIDLSVTFNLMLATIFALTLTMSFSIGVELWRRRDNGAGKKWSYRTTTLFAGGLTAFLVTLAGNMQTIYAFTKGYVGDKVEPFWKLFWPASLFWQKLPEGIKTYWYANATRFIPYTIHEFPSYSFVVSDVHGHVLSLPFVLLAIGLLIQMMTRDKRPLDFNQGAQVIHEKNSIASLSLLTPHVTLIFYGFLVGVLLMTNALDGPIYLMLFIVIFLITTSHLKNPGPAGRQEISIIMKTLGITIGVAGITSLPFLVHFKSFVSGVAVNCPPAFLANSKIGPILFEGVEKCQHSPLWMVALLWGFFVFCGIWLIVSGYLRVGGSEGAKNHLMSVDKFLVLFFFFSVALIIFPEFLYFKDIYPMHFRSNTMFKLGYQAFILFSIVSAYAIVSFFSVPKNDRPKRFFLWKSIFFLFLLPQIFLVSIYPLFSVRSYFNSLKKYEGLDGFGWLRREYPDDAYAILWLNKQAISQNNSNFSLWPIPSHVSPPVLVEADGDSYTDYARFSSFTGMPTIIGWPVHEWLWRGSYDVVYPRREEVRQIYESKDFVLTEKILSKYHVRYIIVGTLERQKFQSIEEWKFSRLGKRVFESGGTVIFDLLQ